MNGLPEPAGQVRQIWAVDRRRASDDAYCEAVRNLVASYLPDAIPSNARVLEDDNGTRILASDSFLTPDRQWVLGPAGQRLTIQVFAELDPEEPLP